MLFELRNALGTIERTMDVILAAVKWQYALVYLDDIFLFSESSEERIEHVRNVLTYLSNASTTLKFEKYCFIAETVDDL